MFLLFSCGNKASTKDAPAIDAKSFDAPRVQNDASLKMCFTNYDCPASEKCFAAPNTTDARCVIGARGTGAAGATCVSENECKSALCVDAAVGQGLKCSDICAGPQDCPSTLPLCISVFGAMICARAL
jgi:hypothetical protein